MDPPPELGAVGVTEQHAFVTKHAQSRTNMRGQAASSVAYQSRGPAFATNRPSGASSPTASQPSDFVGSRHSSWPHGHGWPGSAAAAAHASEQNPSRRAAHVHPG